jgi:hypothetical protein
MSCDPAKTSFSETDLVELDWVLEEVCSVLKDTMELGEDRKNTIRRRLFMLVCNGMSDLDALRDHLILSFERSEARTATRRGTASPQKLRDPVECRQRATRCAELATNSSHPVARQRYHDLAKTWLALAVQLDAQWALRDKWREEAKPENA